MAKRAKTAAIAAAVGIAVLASSSASAFSINFVGDTGVKGTVDFTFASASSMTIKLTNTTVAPQSGDLRGIFFNLVTGVSWDSTITQDNTNPLDWVVGTGANMQPSGTFDLCGQTPEKGGGNNNNNLCNAGIPTSGLVAPPLSWDAFTIGLTGWTGSAADLETAFKNLFATGENVCLRYQAISGGLNGQDSDKVCGTYTPRPPDPVPEPGTLALLGLGLLGLGAARRRNA